jgi:hypothetical protein
MDSLACSCYVRGNNVSQDKYGPQRSRDVAWQSIQQDWVQGNAREEEEEEERRRRVLGNDLNLEG